MAIARRCTIHLLPGTLPAVLMTAKMATMATAVHRICIAADGWNRVILQITETSCVRQNICEKLCSTRNWSVCSPILQRGTTHEPASVLVCSFTDAPACRP